MNPEEAVRQPLRTRVIPRRTLDERVAARLPWLLTATSRALMRLSPGSRLRRAALKRLIESGIAAFNRRDLDSVALSFHPDLEYRPYREFVEAGLAEPCYRGRAGYKEYIEATTEVWGEEVRLEPTELVDLGDRIVILADMPMRAQASGVALAETYGSVWTIRAGLAVRVEDYLDQAEALRAAGVDG